MEITVERVKAPAQLQTHGWALAAEEMTERRSAPEFSTQRPGQPWADERHLIVVDV
jgi:hypothetical protein